MRTKVGTLKVPDFPAACEEMSQPRLFTHHGASVLTTPGSVVVLECRVERLWSPILEPTFIWKLNGKELVAREARFSFRIFPCLTSLTSPPNNVSQSLHLPSASRCLYIWSFGREAVGNYSCEVGRGRDRKFLSLIHI